jgi:hypothetical protein
MENEFDSEETFVVNYELIAREKSLLSLTRLLASEMSKKPYVIVGNYIKEMSNSDLQTLIDIFDQGEHHENFSDIVLLAEMLAQGEGLECGNFDVIHYRSNQFMMFVTCESLSRKKLVKVHHANMSFGEDMHDAIIAEKL